VSEPEKNRKQIKNPTWNGKSNLELKNNVTVRSVTTALWGGKIPLAEMWWGNSLKNKLQTWFFSRVAGLNLAWLAACTRKMPREVRHKIFVCPFSPAHCTNASILAPIIQSPLSWN